MPTVHVLFGTAFPVQRRSWSARNAFPCLSPLPCSQLRLFLPTCSSKKFPHMCLVSSTAIEFSPPFGTTFRYVAKEQWLAPWHSPCFLAQRTCPRVSLKGLFVPSLAARLKNSYHRQREGNILQVCNSLKHWTCSNMSLLLGRREDMFRLWSTMTHLEYLWTFLVTETIFCEFCLCQETQAHKFEVMPFCLHDSGLCHFKF